MADNTSTVADIMSRNVLFAHSSHSFTRLCRLFFEMDIHHLPVVDDSAHLIGIISANDVLKAYGRKLPALGSADEDTLNGNITVFDLMTSDPICVAPEASLGEAAVLLAENNIQSLPVVEEGRVVGIITSRDLVRHLADKEK